MGFDFLAPHYLWIERLCAGGKLQRCRTAFLNLIPTPSSVLILGEGNGRFLTAFCRRFPEADVMCVDASAKMLDLARLRLIREGLDATRVNFVQADVLDWSPPREAFDLVVTHFFFDCFTADQLRQLLPLIASAGKPQAQWLMADFKLADAGLKRLRSRVIIAILYAFFRLTTGLAASAITPLDPILLASRFTLKQRSESDWGLLHSDWWSRG